MIVTLVAMPASVLGNEFSIRFGRRLARSTRTHSVEARQTNVLSAGRTINVSRQDLTRRIVRTQVATTSSSPTTASAR